MNAPLMKLVRRTHLVLGLLLAPWAALYGVTALLFNHPAWWSERQDRSVPIAVLDGTPLARADVSLIQADAAAALGETRGDAGLGALELVEIRETGGFDIRVEDEAMSHRVWIPAQDADIRISSAARDRQGDAGRSLDLRIPAFDRRLEQAEAGLTSLMDVIGLRHPVGQPDLRRTPQLSLVANDGTRHWEGTYDPRRGRLQLRPHADASSGSVRSFLTHLHVSHGYGSTSAARVGWALAVDAMGFAMLLWTVTGLLMWWQLVRIRGLGWVCVLLGVTAFAVLGIALSSEFRG